MFANKKMSINNLCKLNFFFLNSFFASQINNNNNITYSFLIN